MIQDIAPSRLINHFEHLTPSADSVVLCFQDNALLVAYDEKSVRFVSRGIPSILRASAPCTFSSWMTGRFFSFRER